MSSINSDLKSINLQFLMVVRECARHHPKEATWKFNLNIADLDRILDMSMEELGELADCGRAVLTILPAADTPSATPASILAALLPALPIRDQF